MSKAENNINSKFNKPNISYFRIILGIITLVMFSITALLGAVGLNEMEKAVPNHHKLYNVLETIMIIIPFFIMGLSLWIIGIFDIVIYGIKKLRNRN
jgi:hypothetical protein